MTQLSEDQGVTIWLTGLSGAGKSTIANALVEELQERGRKVELLDGDIVRTNLSKGLGFSKEDRDTNIRRIGFVSNLLTRNGVASIVAAISPYRDVRDEVRAHIGSFVEVYVQCPLDELVRRDVKGLYEKALRGEIENFTGVSDPYEAPENPEVIVDTEAETIEESVSKVLSTLERLGYLGDCEGACCVMTTATPTETQLIEPHGGHLIDRWATNPVDLADSALTLPRITLTERQLSDAYLIAQGAFSPLEGFLASEDYRSVRDEMRLASGGAWSIPVTLAVDEATASHLREGEDAALATENGGIAGTIEVAELYTYDKQAEAERVFRTQEEAHPRCSRTLRTGAGARGRTHHDAARNAAAGPRRDCPSTKRLRRHGLRSRRGDGVPS